MKAEQYPKTLGAVTYQVDVTYGDETSAPASPATPRASAQVGAAVDVGQEFGVGIS